MATPRVKEIIFVLAEAAACLESLFGPNRSVASLQNAVVVVVVPEGIAVDTDQILAVLSLGPDVGTDFSLIVELALTGISISVAVRT